MRGGITLVECLTSLAVLGAVVIIAVPAVRVARESSRRTSCADNARTIVQGVIECEGAMGRFPPAVAGDPAKSPISVDITSRRANWAITVLPFLQQLAVHDEYQHSESPASDANRLVRSTRLPVFTCPSDEFAGKPFMGSKGPDTVAWGDDWARGNYGANGSIGFLGTGGDACGSSPEGWANRYRRGVMGFNTGVKASQITDGLSSTIAILELRAGLTAYDPRGVWALGMPGASSLWAHGGVVNHAKGPNSAFLAADDVPNCIQLRAAFGGAVGLADQLMGCDPEGSARWRGSAARSMHYGGIFVSFADGSVRWLSDYVDFIPSNETALSVWDRLNLSADGQMVSADSL